MFVRKNTMHTKRLQDNLAVLNFRCAQRLYAAIHGVSIDWAAINKQSTDTDTDTSWWPGSKQGEERETMVEGWALAHGAAQVFGNGLKPKQTQKTDPHAHVQM